MNYYRARTPSWLIVTVVAVTCAVLTVTAVREYIARVRITERARVVTEAAALERSVRADMASAWQIELDSLRLLATSRDTVVQRVLRVVHDTSWLPADTSTAVRYGACRVTLDTLASECAAFRVTASAALAVADSLHRADSASAHTFALVATVARDSLADARRAAATMVSRGTLWKNRAEYGAVGTATGVVLCLLFCR